MGIFPDFSSQRRGKRRTGASQPPRLAPHKVRTVIQHFCLILRLATRLPPCIDPLCHRVLQLPPMDSFHLSVSRYCRGLSRAYWLAGCYGSSFFYFLSSLSYRIHEPATGRVFGWLALHLTDWNGHARACEYLDTDD